jgi:hypothetical protein
MPMNPMQCLPRFLFHPLVELLACTILMETVIIIWLTIPQSFLLPWIPITIITITMAAIVYMHP